MQQNVLSVAAVFAVGMVCGLTRAARAECPERWISMGNVPGAGTWVTASTWWDPDQEGPRPEHLVIGGSFEAAGNVTASRVAAYNPITGSWIAMGEGFDGDVSTLTVLLNGDLVAGGAFVQSGSTAVHGLARWNGTSWEAVGFQSDGWVRAASRFGRTLVVGGTFGTVNGTPMAGVARWDGAVWQPLGTGVAGTVLKLCEHNGALIAGGVFSAAGGAAASNIARWDGAAWQPLGDGVDDAVTALLSDGAYLYAGGLFETAGGNIARYVARWNGGSWQPLGVGADGLADAWAEGVNALAVDLGGRVVAGGDFQTAGGVAVNSIAAWNESTWSALGLGVAGFPNPPIRTLTLGSDGSIYAGGFFGAAGGAPAASVARWNGSNWNAIPAPTGVSGQINAMEVFRGELVLLGSTSFTHVGTTAVNHIARWDGQNYASLGTGLGPAGVAFGAINGLAVHGDELIVAGSFATAGDVPASNIARWNGSSWAPLGAGLSDIGRGMAVWQGSLVVGGEFTSAGGIPANRIASWDGTDWAPLGDGLDGIVRDVTVFNNEIIACGGFSHSGATPVSRVARWDGATWSPLGAGLNGTALALCVLPGGDLIVGGAFTLAGGQLAHRVARWDGASWSSMGDGLSRTVRSLAIGPDGAVLAGTGDNAGDGLFRWNGTSWEEVLSTDRGVLAIATLPDGSVAAGGVFTAADGAATPWWTIRQQVSGDLNGDTCFDLSDWQALGGCVSGPDTPSATGCGCGSTNADSDVDLADFAVLQRRFGLGCPDCNGNGVPDTADLAHGTGADCDSSGTLDECEILAGTSTDCQPNGVPDACDLAAGTSQDANGDGVPDECQPGLVVLTDFEGYADGTEVMFQDPRFSQSTSGFLLGVPNDRGVSSAVPAFAGSKSYRLSWQFIDNNLTNWVRITSFNTTAKPNPTIPLDRPIRIRIRLDTGALRVALGVRETGTNSSIGGNGGTTGTIEWVGATTVNGTAPQGRLIQAMPGVWQTLVFDLAADPIGAFTGDGQLSSTSGRGTLEHIAFSSTGAAGPFVVYLDQIEVLP